MSIAPNEPDRSVSPEAPPPVAGGVPAALPAGVPEGVPAASWGAPPTSGPTPNLATAVLVMVAVAVAGGAVWALVLTYTRFVFAIIAVLVGAGTGTAVVRWGGGRQSLAGLAVVLTVVGCLAGHVLGTWGHLHHTLHPIFGVKPSWSEIRRIVPPREVLRHTSAFSWAFVAFGGFTAFRTATGRRRAMGRRPAP